jgi:hypothetical protein
MSKPWSEIKHKRDDRTQKELAADGQKSAQQSATFGERTLADLVAPNRSQTTTPRVDSGVRPGDWLNSLTSAERKDIPMARGLLDYFPDALAAVARHSKQGNDKHNPGQPLHWSRHKSSDHADCILRHLAGRGKRDSADGSRHSVGLAWRALAMLQLEIEDAVKAGEKV